MQSFFDCRDYIAKITNVYRATSKLGYSHVENRLECELVYKINGTSDQHFEDRTIRLIPHSLYFIPNRFKSNYVIVDEPGDIINIRFKLFDCDREAELVPELFELPENNRIVPLYDRILSVWYKRTPASKLEAQAIMMQILAEVVNIRSTEYLSSASYLRIKPAIELIEREYRRPIDIDELTQLCGISGEYLRRLFRTYIGSNPIEYLRSVRLRNAKDMLFASTDSISDIAKACGFDDPRYFTRLYKREYGITPSAAAKGTVG